MSVYGASTGRLISWLPKVADWTLSGLPEALSEVEVRTLLDPNVPLAIINSEASSGGFKNMQRRLDA